MDGRSYLVRPAPPPPTADRPYAFGAGAPLWREELPEGDGWRDRDDLLIMSFDQLPSTLMHHPMVASTEQDQVVEVGRTALDPMHQVMSIAHRGGAFASWPAAVPVASLQGSAQSSRDHPLGAPDVDRHGVLAEQDAGHAAVASHPLHRGRGDRERELHLRPRGTGQALEGL